jgi:hypothetical protein
MRSLEAKEQSMSKSSRCVLAAAMALALQPLAMHAQTKLPALDAEINTTYTLADGRQFSRSGHYYRSQDGKLREDSPLGAIITDTKARTITVLNFATKEARIVKVSAKAPASSIKGKSMSASAPPAEAMVDGRRVMKSHVANAPGESQELWTARDLGLVVFSKISSPTLTTAKSLRNVSLRNPDPSLFAVPKGYTVSRLDTSGPSAAPALPAPPLASSKSRVPGQ